MQQQTPVNQVTNVLPIEQLQLTMHSTQLASVDQPQVTRTSSPAESNNIQQQHNQQQHNQQSNPRTTSTPNKDRVVQLHNKTHNNNIVITFKITIVQ